ncbi:MAG: radical SAM protein [Anaerolineales bacterium]|nr:radical SAM protein [Anaerolineales bacterium]
MSILNRVSELFTKVQPLPEGTHHLQAAADRDQPYRIHLRLLKDGTGILIVNASTVLHLNPSAAECAYHFIKGTEAEEAAKQIAARYRVNKDAALRDFNDFTERIKTLIETPDLDPVSFLGFERVAPHSASLATPLRLDCALTYKLPTGSKADYAPVKRVKRELTTEEWQSILDKAWRAGVPHVTFTGGEATLREDLSQLIARAESNGQVCGLLTDGMKLADKKYLETLLQTGLDHILFLLQPQEKKSWKALETVLAEDIFVTVHLTIHRNNAAKIDSILERLAKVEVKSLSVTMAKKFPSEKAKSIHDKAASLGITLRSDLPVPYSADNPVAVETSEEQVPDGAGNAWMYVEPDGDVLPAQGMADRPLGNLLKDEWSALRPS